MIPAHQSSKRLKRVQRFLYINVSPAKEIEICEGSPGNQAMTHLKTITRDWGPAPVASRLPETPQPRSFAAGGCDFARVLLAISFAHSQKHRERNAFCRRASDR